MCKARLHFIKEVLLMTTGLLNTWKRKTNQLKMEVYAIYLAYKDPRVRWYAKILIVCVIGYLDHLFLVPMGVVLAFRKMIPSAVLTDRREMVMNRLKPN